MLWPSAGGRGNANHLRENLTSSAHPVISGTREQNPGVNGTGVLKKPETDLTALDEASPGPLRTSCQG